VGIVVLDNALALIFTEFFSLSIGIAQLLIMLELNMRVAHDYNSKKQLFAGSDDVLNRKIKILYFGIFISITAVLICGFVLPFLTDQRF
jgi:hypothetical protein